MSLSNDEIVRCKFELGYSVVSVGAEVYVGYSPIFDVAIQPYLTDVGSTSTTSVVANDSGALVSVTVAANPASVSSTQSLAFILGGHVVVGHGASQETSVIEAISGLILSLTLFKAHSGTYSVRVQGAEQIVRDCFDRLDRIKAEMLNVAPITAGLNKLVGEVEFFNSGKGGMGGRSKFEDLLFQRDTARRDLAAALNVPYLFDLKSGNTSMEVY